MLDMIVAGGGPAGLAAAIYGLRGGKSVLIVEKTALGGQIVYSPRVENYPGFKEISGSELAERLAEQAASLGAQVKLTQVTGAADRDGYKAVFTPEGELTAKALIVAPGAKPRRLGLEREEELTGRGISFCAVCDGALFRGKAVAVVGGGNTALQDAAMLADVCERVYLIYRRDTLRGEARLEGLLRGKANVEFWPLSRVTALEGEKALSGITVDSGGAEKHLAVEGLFAAVGYEPDTAPFAGLVKLDGDGYVLAGEDCAAGPPGVFAAGDCRRKKVRQLATAVADGAVAGLAASEYIDTLK